MYDFMRELSLVGMLRKWRACLMNDHSSSSKAFLRFIFTTICLLAFHFLEVGYGLLNNDCIV